MGDDSKHEVKYISLNSTGNTTTKDDGIVPSNNNNNSNKHSNHHRSSNNHSNSIDAKAPTSNRAADDTLKNTRSIDNKQSFTRRNDDGYRHNDDIIDMIHVGGDQNNDTTKLLSLAEQLLSNVTKCIIHPLPSSSSSSSFSTSALPKTIADKTHHHVTSPNAASSYTISNELDTNALLPEQIEKLLSHPNYTTLPMQSIRDTDSQMAQIEWLLSGLPEAYDSEPYYDDEAVEAILKEGGSPPNQLKLPSVYAINQHILSKLANTTILRVRFDNLLVFSTRYGIRKEGTYLLIHPPIGTITPSNESSTVMLPLTELEDPSYKVSQILRRNSKKDSVRNYFVGSIELVDKCVNFDLSINDRIMIEWIKGTANGCIKVELFGYLAPRDSMIRGRIIEPVCIGSTRIPLGGLLGAPSLDVILNCDIEVDISNHSAIVSRMNNISFGQVITKPKPLGSKLGTLTTRISLLSTSKEPLKNNQNSNSDLSADTSVSRRSGSSSKTNNTSVSSAKAPSQSAILSSLLNMNPANQEAPTLVIPVIDDEIKHLQLEVQKDKGVGLREDIDNGLRNNGDDYGTDIAKYIQQKRIDYISNDSNQKQFQHISDDKLHDALSFKITEAPKSNSKKLNGKFIGNDEEVYGNFSNDRKLNSYFSIAFCALLNLQIPVNCMVQLKNQDDIQRQNDFVISFKLNTK